MPMKRYMPAFTIVALSCLAVFAFILNSMAAAQATGQDVSFTFFEQRKFFVFISYFDALRASDSILDSDFAYIKSKGIDGIRIFPNWHDDDGDWNDVPSDTLMDGSGRLRSVQLSKLRTVLSKARDHGLVVEVSFAREVAGLQIPVFKNGILETVGNIRNWGFKNVLIDIQNEHNGVPAMYISPQDAQDIINLVKSAAPEYPVGASVAYDISTADAIQMANAENADMITYHDPRYSDWYQRTGDVVRELRAGNKPVYLSEPERWRQNSGLAADSFLIAVAQAKSAGAAAWTFHTESAFWLNRGSMQSQLGNPEKEFLDALVSKISTTAWGISASNDSSLDDLSVQFTCSNGFSCTSASTQNICAPRPYMPIGNEEKSFTFTAAKTGRYKCEIRVIANHFDYASALESNEISDVYLNGLKIGSTEDLWCPPGGGGTQPPALDCTDTSECCNVRASNLDCNKYPEGSGGCTEPKLLCDDDPFKVESEKKLVLSLADCKPGAVAFIKQSSSIIPRCQNWPFTPDVSDRGFRCPQSGFDISGSIIRTYDCSKARNYNIDPSLPPGQYTIGAWSPWGQAESEWSGVDFCEIPGDTLLYTETRVDAGDGICMGGSSMVCGNGIIDGSEQCDGSDLNSQTCATQGYDKGTLGCKADCTFDVSFCEYDVPDECSSGETACNGFCCRVDQYCLKGICMSKSPPPAY